MSNRIGPPPGRPIRCAPKPPPMKAGPIPAQNDMDNFIKACIKGDAEEIVWFLKYYPHQWGVHCKGKIGLMFAAENGRAHAVNLLLNRNSDIDAVDQKKMTALLYAVDAGQDKVVSLLIEKGARKDVESDGGWTAFHMAANHG